DISSLLEDKTDTSESEVKVEDKEGTETPEKETEAKPSYSIPEGVEVITMPRLSDTMEEGTVAQWLKKEGDTVEEGDILAEIETDKATMEFESFYSGTLLKIGIQEGESAKVDKLLAILGPEGTDVSEVLKNFDKNKENKKGIKTETKKEVSKKVEPKTKKTESSVSASQKSKSKKVNTSTDKRIFVSPLARKLADEKNINLKFVQPSGDNNRIVKRDIENYQPGGTSDGFVPVTEEA